MDRMFNKRRKEKGEGDGKNVLSAGFSSSLVFSLVLSPLALENHVEEASPWICYVGRRRSARHELSLRQ